jgi:aminoglycoside phosphotransferase family enzyme/gluconate kinase
MSEYMPPATDHLHRLVHALQAPRLFDHPVDGFQVLETHISLVLLTGPYAYKLKKPVDLGFLDFSTLEKRRFYCEEEVRLNRRLAAGYYLRVVPIGGSVDAPILNRQPAIEYMVQMRQFPQRCLLDRVLSAGGLKPRHMDAIATRVAEFHASLTGTGSDSSWGSPETVYRPVDEDFRQIRPHLTNGDQRQRLDRLEQWAQAESRRLHTAFVRRRDSGMVRECHGDMHLGNIALVDDEIIIFDGIEFNPGLRWIDLISEVAFLVMDLDSRGREDLARRFLNAYLERTGDYGALPLLPFYLAYRALVRAKVARIRAAQEGLNDDEQGRLEDDYQRHIELAERYTQPTRPMLILLHGVSGSGKSTLGQQLVEGLGAIRLRSDVERKRMHGLDALADSQAAIYSPEADERTYARLAELAREVIGGGRSAVLDATFLQRQRRLAMRQLADDLRVPFVIMELTAEASVLRRRVVSRQELGRDASEASLAVLERQLADREALSEEERAHTLTVDSSAGLPSMDECLRQLHRLGVCRI